MTDVEYTAQERAQLAPHFTNHDRPIFALRGLPEVVKGALFARYSRSSKSLRRLFLDEFASARDEVESGVGRGVGAGKASKLYDRVFVEYGDDSVAQLGAAHVACEGVSNVLTKVLERGRLASYLEQSTRYIYYHQKRPDGHYRYVTPREVVESGLEGAYTEVLDGLFDLYAELVPQVQEFYESAVPRAPGDSEGVWRAAVRARVCDDLRGLLPAATQSNVGIFASGQAYEALLVRMRASELAEVRECAAGILSEAREVIPSFLARVDVPERGGRWSQYRQRVERAMSERSVEGTVAEAPVRLVDWDPDGELKVAAAALYACSTASDAELLRHVRGLNEDERRAIIEDYVGQRANRRHRPGRAFERTSYRFDVLAPYSVFRDLQRHRLMTLDWQRLTTEHGYEIPSVIDELGGSHRWTAAMERAADLHENLRERLGSEVAQYAVPFGYRIRFFMDMNAREAMHVIELRTQPGGDPVYRALCSEMRAQIRDVAAHRTIAASMVFTNDEPHILGRLAGERRLEKKLHRRAEDRGGSCPGDREPGAEREPAAVVSPQDVRRLAASISDTIAVTCDVSAQYLTSAQFSPYRGGESVPDLVVASTGRVAVVEFVFGRKPWHYQWVLQELQSRVDALELDDGRAPDLYLVVTDAPSDLPVPETPDGARWAVVRSGFADARERTVERLRVHGFPAA